MATKQESQGVMIKGVNMKTVVLPIRGFEGPLVVHNWSEKAIREMLQKQMKAGKVTKGKEAKNPEQCFRETLYSYEEDGQVVYGFPATAFKSAMVRATKILKDTKQLDLDMIAARQILFVIADGQENRTVTVPLGKDTTFSHQVTTDLVRIEGEPRMRMDMVRLNGKTADIRFRGEFPEWSANLTIQYNADILDEQTIANLCYRAGMTVGIGEGRPSSKNSDMGWGRFEIGE